MAGEMCQFNEQWIEAIKRSFGATVTRWHWRTETRTVHWYNSSHNTKAQKLNPLNPNLKTLTFLCRANMQTLNLLIPRNASPSG